MTEQQPGVMIAIPSYTGQVCMGTMRSLLSDMIDLMKAGFRVRLHDESGGAEIARAREDMVSVFMASDYDHLVMVDADVCWQEGAIRRLISHGYDFAAAAYPRREDPISFPVQFDDATNVEMDDMTHCIKARAVAAGFIVLSRAALQKMTKEFASLKYQSSKGNGRDAWLLFSTLKDGDNVLSEDLSFCKRWRDIGGSIWVDPGIMMGHIGPKVFVGNLGHFEEVDNAKADG